MMPSRGRTPASFTCGWLQRTGVSGNAVPPTPCAPVHGCRLVILRGFEVVVAHLLFQAEPLIFLILGFIADIGQVVLRVREDEVGLALIVDPRDLVLRQPL